MVKYRLIMSQYKRLLKIAIPIAIQQVIFSSANFIDTLMIGQLGEASIASVGLSGQFFFVYNLIIFGLVSGGSIFIAQFWGQKEMNNISKTTAFMTMVSLALSSVFFLMAAFFPEFTMRLFSPDPEVIRLGAGYMEITSFTYLTFAITMVMSFTLRNTEHTTIPMLVSMVSMGANTFLNWIFIFGQFGLEPMGVNGAALGTLISRIIEVIMFIIIINAKKLPGRFNLDHIRMLNKKFILRFIKYALPTVGNELFWSLGVTMYTIIYSYIGTNVIAANRIMGSIENFTFSILFALSSGAAVLIGQELGKSNFEMARKISRMCIKLVVVLAIGIGIFVIGFSEIFLSLFNVLPEVRELARIILILAMSFLPFKILNGLFIAGVLRAGGDTRFAFMAEVGCLWGIGVPLIFIAGMVLKLPYPIVYSLTMAEELIKLTILIKRYRTGKWLNNVIDTLH